MKSKYIKPQTLVINMGALQLLSGSGGVSDDGKKATLNDEAPTSGAFSQPWHSCWGGFTEAVFVICRVCKFVKSLIVSL